MRDVPPFADRDADTAKEKKVEIIKHKTLQWSHKEK